jgi:hypothetical protein
MRRHSRLGAVALIAMMPIALQALPAEAANGCSPPYGTTGAKPCITVSPAYGPSSGVKSDFYNGAQNLYLTMKQCDGNGQNCGNIGQWFTSYVSSYYWPGTDKGYILYHTYRTHGTWDDPNTGQTIYNAVSPLSAG